MLYVRPRLLLFLNPINLMAATTGLDEINEDFLEIVISERILTAFHSLDSCRTGYLQLFRRGEKAFHVFPYLGRGRGFPTLLRALREKRTW